LSLASSGDLDHPINEFKEALRLKPDYSEARAYLNTAVQSTPASKPH
jgi:hypothetical protein